MSRTPGKKNRTNLQKSKDKALIEDLYLSGHTSGKLAKLPQFSHISKKTIEKIITDCEKEYRIQYRAENADKRENLRLKQIARHEKQLRELDKDLQVSRDGLSKEAADILIKMLMSGEISQATFDKIKENSASPGHPLIHKEIRENFKELSKLYDAYPVEKKKIDINETPKDSIEELTAAEAVELLKELQNQEG